MILSMRLRSSAIHPSVFSLNVTDGCSQNSNVHLELPSGSADRYNVSDNTGPSVIKYVFGENGKTLAPGDKLHVKVKLDDQSDITGCDVFFQGKNNQDAAIGVILEYDAASDMFKGEYELTEFDVNDTYTLDAISAQDKYGNFTQVWNEKAGLGSFTLQGGIVTLKVRPDPG